MTEKQIDKLRQESMDYFGFGTEAMKKVKVCSHCGQTAPTDQRFCKECGHRLPENTLYQSYKERHKFCPHCETIVADNVHYCPQCGNIIEQEEKENGIFR